MESQEHRLIILKLVFDNSNIYVMQGVLFSGLFVFQFSMISSYFLLCFDHFILITQNVWKKVEALDDVIFFWVRFCPLLEDRQSTSSGSSGVGSASGFLFWLCPSRILEAYQGPFSIACPQPIFFPSLAFQEIKIST